MIVPLCWNLSRKYFKLLLGHKNPLILESELNLFTKIFSQCKVIVDVGARLILIIYQFHRAIT